MARPKIIKKKQKEPSSTPELNSIPGRASSSPAHFDKLIHERVRLGIISALSANESLTFSELKELLETSDGNVSVHARKLEEATYIKCEKSFVGRKPLTKYKITKTGRKALEGYIDHMAALIKSVKGKM